MENGKAKSIHHGQCVDSSLLECMAGGREHSLLVFLISQWEVAFLSEVCGGANLLAREVRASDKHGLGSLTITTAVPAEKASMGPCWPKASWLSG